MKDTVKKIAKIFASLGSILTFALVVAIVLVINPRNVPAIFKRNYPDWFAAHPHISKLISVD